MQHLIYLHGRQCVSCVFPDYWTWLELHITPHPIQGLSKCVNEQSPIIFCILSVRELGLLFSAWLIWALKHPMQSLSKLSISRLFSWRLFNSRAYCLHHISASLCWGSTLKKFEIPRSEQLTPKHVQLFSSILLLLLYLYDAYFICCKTCHLKNK